MLQSSLVRSLVATLLVLSGVLVTSLATQAEIAAPEQTVVLSIDDRTITPGETGTFEINLNNAVGPPIFAGQITIDYDSSIGLTLTAMRITNRTSGFTATLGQPNADQASILFYNTTGSTISSGTGAILEVDYTVTSNASGNTTLSFSQALLSDTSGSNITTNTDNGLFTVDDGSNNGNARIYVEPASSNMNVGGTQILRVMVAPGSAEVNGVQVHAKVDPAHLTILNVQGNTTEMTSVLESATFNASTGIFSYAAGRLGSTVNTTFEILQVEVRAVAATSGTVVEFLSTFPKTDVNGPGSDDGSVMDTASNGVVVIDSGPTSATLLGEIGLQGRPNGSSFSKAVPVTIQLFSVGGTTPLLTFNDTLDQNGRFTRSGIAPGTYDIRMLNSHTLASRVRNVVLNPGDNSIYLGPLREGDVFQNNQILTNDFSLLSQAFGLCSFSSTDFDDRTDLNEDNCTDIDDFGLLSGNLNTQGDVTYDVGNPPPLPIELVAATMALQVPNVAGKAAGETFEVIVLIDTKASEVNGATAHILFDPASLEVVEVTLSVDEILPITLQESTVNNNVGTVSFSKGRLNDTISDERFELATLTMRLKEETEAASLAFSDAFPATNVTGKEGTVLAETVVEELVTGTDVENVPPSVSDTEEQTTKNTSENSSETGVALTTGEYVFLPLILR